MSQLLRLQQENHLPSEVTAEDMTELLVEQSKEILRVQLWEFELDGYDADVRPLLQLTFQDQQPGPEVRQPPAHTASPEPDSAVASTPPCALTTFDEPPADTASPEPDSAVVSASLFALTTCDEPPAHTAIQNVFKRSLDEIEKQPIPYLEPDSAVVASAPPAVQTPYVEPPANIAGEETKEQQAQTSELDPVMISAPPHPLTVVNKAKKSRFLKWILKDICCCFVDEGDTEMGRNTSL
ncbi:hypothetical protein GBF38_003705 [Nibea albiflora]|uniref:Uncharacterized protein n=1 Tax=Nibea albiflora TaxID=240163 RepID=A0ACB7F224_NIBAL|nr:hypothetical protein GBF38_003705 [Nibea albiflora]